MVWSLVAVDEGFPRDGRFVADAADAVRELGTFFDNEAELMWLHPTHPVTVSHSSAIRPAFAAITLLFFIMVYQPVGILL